MKPSCASQPDSENLENSTIIDNQSMTRHSEEDQSETTQKGSDGTEVKNADRPKRWNKSKTWLYEGTNVISHNHVDEYAKVGSATIAPNSIADTGSDKEEFLEYDKEGIQVREEPDCKVACKPVVGDGRRQVDDFAPRNVDEEKDTTIKEPSELIASRNFTPVMEEKKILQSKGVSVRSISREPNHSGTKSHVSSKQQDRSEGGHNTSLQEYGTEKLRSKSAGHYEEAGKSERVKDKEWGVSKELSTADIVVDDSTQHNQTHIRHQSTNKQHANAERLCHKGERSYADNSCRKVTAPLQLAPKPSKNDATTVQKQTRQDTNCVGPLPEADVIAGTGRHKKESMAVSKNNTISLSEGETGNNGEEAVFAMTRGSVERNTVINSKREPLGPFGIADEEATSPEHDICKKTSSSHIQEEYVDDIQKRNTEHFNKKEKSSNDMNGKTGATSSPEILDDDTSKELIVKTTSETPSTVEREIVNQSVGSLKKSIEYENDDEHVSETGNEKRQIQQVVSDEGTKTSSLGSGPNKETEEIKENKLKRKRDDAVRIAETTTNEEQKGFFGRNEEVESCGKDPLLLDPPASRLDVEEKQQSSDNAVIKKRAPTTCADTKDKEKAKLIPSSCCKEEKKHSKVIGEDRERPQFLVKRKVGVEESTQPLPKRANIKTPSHSYAFNAFDFEQTKLRLYSEGAIVHGTDDYDSKFSNYWDVMRMRLDGQDTQVGLSRINSFLTTRKMRKLHNKLIKGLLGWCLRSKVPYEQIANFVPSCWNQRIKISSDDFLCEQPLKRLPTTLESKPIIQFDQFGYLPAIAEAGKSPYSERKSVHAKIRIPGALAIDQQLKASCHSMNLKMRDDNILWLVVAAAKEYTSKTLKGCIALKKSIHIGKMKRPRCISSSIARPEKKLRRDPSNPDLPKETRHITPLDMQSFIATLPMAGVRHQGGALSRITAERTLMATYETLPPFGTAFLELKKFLWEKIAPSYSETITFKKAPEHLPVLPCAPQGAFASQIESRQKVQVGRGRGAKNLAALKIRTSATKADKSAVLTDTSESGRVSTGSHLSNPRHEAASASSSTQEPVLESSDRPVSAPESKQSRGKGVGSKDLATLRAGVKDLAAMKARSSGEQQKPTQAKSQGIDN